MPSPILKFIVRTAFLEAGIQAFFDKVILNFRLSDIGLKKYTGQIEVGMRFKVMVFKGTNPLEKELSYSDVEVIRIAEMGMYQSVVVSYWDWVLKKRTRTSVYIDEMDYYI